VVHWVESPFLGSHDLDLPVGLYFHAFLWFISGVKIINEHTRCWIELLLMRYHMIQCRVAMRAEERILQWPERFFVLQKFSSLKNHFKTTCLSTYHHCCRMPPNVPHSHLECIICTLPRNQFSATSKQWNTRTLKRWDDFLLNKHCLSITVNQSSPTCNANNTGTEMFQIFTTEIYRTHTLSRILQEK